MGLRLNYWHTRMCQNMKLHSWWWFNVVFSMVIKRKEMPGCTKLTARGDCSTTVWDGYSQRSREAGWTNGWWGLTWNCSPSYISSLGRQTAWGVTSLNHFMAHQLRAQEKGAVPRLSLHIWISCGSPAHQFLNYQAKVLCVHLCMVAVYPYMCICICIYIPIFIYTSRIEAVAYYE